VRCGRREVLIAAAIVATLLSPAHGHAVVTGSNLERSVLVTSAIAIGCTREGAACPKAVTVSFPDRPDVVYPATVRTVTKLGLRAGLAVLTVDRPELMTVPISKGISQGDVLALAPACGGTGGTTYVTSVGEDGVWIRSGLQATSAQAGCPLVDSAGNLVAVVDGSPDPLAPSPAFLAMTAALSSNPLISIDRTFATASLDQALDRARALTPSGDVPQSYTSDERWVNAMPWWCRAAELGNLDATVMCARGYATGDGARMDIARAAALFGRAAQRGSAPAHAALNELNEQYGDELRSRTRALAQANKDDAAVQFEIGAAYRRGVGAAEDASQAAVWFSRCATTMSACAFYLGRAFLDGRGVIANEKHGVDLIEWAAGHCEPAPKTGGDDDYYLNKCERAYLELAIYYNNDYRASYDPAKARHYYELIATRNAFARDKIKEIDAKGSVVPSIAASQKPLRERIADAVLYQSTHSSQQFYATNAALFRQIAATNDPEALYAAGVFFSGTWIGNAGAVGDDETAFHYFKRAADAGEYRAAHALSIAYLAGTGVNKDADASARMGLVSVDLARKAAAKQDVQAYRFLGSAYMYGRINYTPVTPDCHEATKWFLLAAAAKDALAYHELGVLYTGQLGFGGTYEEDAACHDAREGERWFRLAIDGGDTDAMVLLALQLNSGGLGRVDAAEARRLLQTAADRGNTEAQSLLLKP
jgi:TPR repeat protein